MAIIYFSLVTLIDNYWKVQMLERFHVISCIQPILKIIVQASHQL